MTDLFPAVHLDLTSKECRASYERVRANAQMRAILDEVMVPALEKDGLPDIRLAAFEKGRVAAVGTYYGTVAGNLPYLTDREKMSRATGSGPHPALDALDRVAVDILDCWFLTLARAIAAGPAAPREKSVALGRLVSLARTCLPWKPQAGENIAVGIMVLRADLG